METGWDDGNKGQLDAERLCVSCASLSALVLIVSKSAKLFKHTSIYTISSSTAQCDRLLGWQRCQQPGGRDAPCCAWILKTGVIPGCILFITLTVWKCDVFISQMMNNGIKKTTLAGKTWDSHRPLYHFMSWDYNNVCASLLSQCIDLTFQLWIRCFQCKGKMCQLCPH